MFTDKNGVDVYEENGLKILKLSGLKDGEGLGLENLPAENVQNVKEQSVDSIADIRQQSLLSGAPMDIDFHRGTLPSGVTPIENQVGDDGVIRRRGPIRDITDAGSIVKCVCDKGHIWYLPKSQVSGSIVIGNQEAITQPICHCGAFIRQAGG